MSVLDNTSKQAIVEFIFYPAGWPLALFFAWYSINTYYQASLTLRNGRTLDKRDAPIRFWIEVAGGALMAAVFAVTGTVYMFKLIIAHN